MSTGSPGGAFIIHYTAKTLLGVLQWGLTPQAAIDLPNFGSLGGPLTLEAERFPKSTVDALMQLGHKVNGSELTSGLQAIVRSEVHGEAGLAGRRRPAARGRGRWATEIGQTARWHAAGSSSAQSAPG